MRKLLAGLAATVLAVSPLALAQEAGGGRPGGGGGGRGAGPGGGAMQERMKEAWAALDKAACFTAMDTNADGNVSKEEFEKADLQAVFGTPLREAMAKRAGAGPGAAAGAGAGAGAAGPQQWDKNGDGKVTAEEFPRGPEAFKKLLENHDKDGDGALSADEIKAARETLQQRQQERRGQQP